MIPVITSATRRPSPINNYERIQPSLNNVTTNCYSAAWQTEEEVQVPQQPRDVQQQDMLSAMLKAVTELSYATTTNWDGEDADALHHDTVRVATKLAELLAGSATSIEEPPEIYPTPRGEIDFSWDVEGRLLIIGVCPPPEHTIVFAGLFGDTKVRGRAAWSDNLPRPVRMCLQMLVNPIV